MHWFPALLPSVIQPQPAPVDVSLWRRFLAKSGIFDLISGAIQIAQARRILRLRAPAPEDTSLRANTIRHNMSQVIRKPLTRRVEAYYQIATTPYRDVSREKVLVIGGRAIHEFFEATLYGFSWGNIVGADLFSTHEKIIEMDMHRLSFETGSFDVVMMINTLGYSETPEVALAEAMRVLRYGGRFVFNHSYRGVPGEFSNAALLHGDEIVAIIRRHGGRIYFHEEFDKINAVGTRQTSHILGVVKRAQTANLLIPYHYKRTRNCPYRNFASVATVS